MFGYFQHDHCKGIERQDFFRFSTEFRQVIYENIPTIAEVIFLDPPRPQPAVTTTENNEEKGMRLGIEKAVEQGRPVLFEDVLLLPFSVDDSTIVAQAKGLDDYLIRKIGTDWLDGLSSLLIREFLLVKRACIDPLTGLLSSLYLEEYLDGGDGKHTGVLVLLTVYPKSSSSFQAKKYQHRTVSLLKDFVDDRFPLYYLGQSCFGIVCEESDSDFAAEFAPLLVNYLKRDGCYRVHVASAVFGEASVGDDPFLAPSEEVMRKAWSALHVATKRGPFAFCNYSSIEDAASHPLAPPAQPLVRWLQKASRKLKTCSLLQFDSGNKLLVQSVRECVGGDTRSFADENAVYLLLPEQDGKEALKTGNRILQHFSKNDKSGLAVNCGISSFPLADLKKSELLLNCRKALCHAAFLDPGSLVIYDAVSCNIAGDMYYGDGDLVLAVKEYRRGLLLDSGNGNLLNSLGVCYAQMNRHKSAVECFRKACMSQEDQFRALYNLGLEQQIRNEKNLAIDSFSEALALPEQEGEEKARKDMSFQLAVLCIEAHRYQKGLDLLLPWYNSEKQQGKRGKALRFLGEACFGLGIYRDAMKYLQHAMRYDEYDAEVLGLLGEMYLKENEGDDIALRFCEKAVELTPDSLSLKLRLAKAQIQCGDFQESLRTLQPCMRNKKTRPAALLQRGVLALEQGRIRAAEKWFVKAESCSDGEIDLEIKKYARLLLE
jgi:tetratricopeptide (TPR) repeat protein